jgi:ABC-type polysaccharide/polyol phosphate transport system ATPase subunit
MCNVACWMEQGEVVMIGSVDDVIPAYLKGIQRPLPVADTRIAGI